MPIRIQIDIIDRMQNMKNFRKRGMNGIIKRSLVAATLYWHRTYAKLHFQREGVERYGLKPNRKTGLPLVLTGNLRRRILQHKTRADVSGTSKGVRLRMRYGRPPAWSDENVRELIFYEMRDRNISYAQAAVRVRSMVGYNQKAKRLFQSKIPKVVSSEAKDLKRVILTHIANVLNRRAPARRRKVV
jgi:hypothetical protein